MNLAERIAAAIDHAERSARRHHLEGVPMVGCVGLHENPAAVLRRCAADRRVLALHRPLTYELTDETATTCNWCDGGTDRVPEWPCPDLEALADRWGVDA